MIFRYIIILFFLSFWAPAQAKKTIDGQVVFENFNSRDGLYHPYIRQIFQDKKGYIWLGTAEGLVRYDGKEFITVKQEGSGTNTLSDNSIYGIYEDLDENAIWVGSEFGGVNRVDTETLTAKNFLTDTTSSSSVNLVIIKSLVQVSKDLLILGTLDNGLFKFTPSTHQYTKINSASLGMATEYYKVYQIKKSKEFVWAATSKGLIKMNFNGEILDIIVLPNRSKEPNKLDEVKSVAIDNNQNVYFATRIEIWRYDTTNNFKFIAKPQIGENQLSVIELDWERNIWAGTNGSGLLYINQNSGKIINFKTNNISKFGIQDNTIESLSFTNDQPILWIGTKSGFTKLDLTREKFDQIDVSEISGSANVFLIFEDSDKGLWFWTPDGLYQRSANESSFHHIKLPLSKANNVNYICEIEGEKFLLATSEGLFIYDIKNNHFEKVPFTIKDINNNNLNNLSTIKHYKNDTYLITTLMGVVEFNLKTKSFALHQLPQDKLKNGFFHLTDILVTSDSTAWIGSRETLLIKYNPLNYTFEFFDSRQKNTGFENSNYILNIAEDKNKNLWLATYGDGLLTFDTKKRTFSSQYAVDELKNHTYAVAIDSTNSVWVTSNFGICRLNLTTNKVENFGKSDGTFCDEFNEGANFVSGNGDIYFGGTNGFVHFNPYYFNTNKYSPPVFISQILYGGEKLSPEKQDDSTSGIIESKKFEISQSKRNLTFIVSVLNYCGSENNKIAWKLEGFDSNWNYGRSNEKIVYSNLPRGTYKLLTKGSNNNNIWNEKGESITIKVTAPFYKTPLAWILIITLIIITLSLFIYYRYDWQRKQKLKLELLVKAKTRDLEQANEELEVSKIEILSQKAELEIHRNYLEETVERRTADLEKAKVKAEESDQLKTAFLANLSHEIRTPMNAIMGFSSLLNTNSFSLKEQKEFINLIMASSETLLVLIDDLLDISRIETSQISISPTSVQISSFTNQLFQSLTFENNNQSTEFLLEVDPELDNIELTTDPTRLKQVITNLASNALKFTKKGFVKITVKKEYYALLKNKGFVFKSNLPVDEEILFFSVEDTGLGIEAQNLEIIFEPFRKIDSPQKEVYGGVGLGLSIVKKLILLLGGEIQVRSVINEGSIFYFYLPLADVIYNDNPSQDEDEDYEDDWS